MSEYTFTKYQRRTIPIGPRIGDLKAKMPQDQEYTHEVYLREMNFAAGGIGAATWDASVILSNFITQNSHYFANSVVHEVGAGVGLPGMVAGRYAKKVIMSDYVPILVENMKYNISLNTQFRDLSEYKEQVGYTDIAYEHVMKLMQEKNSLLSAEEMPRTWRHTGYITPDESIVEDNRENMRRNMYNSTNATFLDWFDFANLSQEERDNFKCDIILGSEVSYSQISDTLEVLVAQINETVSATGAVYLIHTVDRGTQPELLAAMEANGFITHIHDVPETLLDFYATGQRRESYKYYTFLRPNSIYPVMKAPYYDQDYDQ